MPSRLTRQFLEPEILESEVDTLDTATQLAAAAQIAPRPAAPTDQGNLHATDTWPFPEALVAPWSMQLEPENTLVIQPSGAIKTLLSGAFRDVRFSGDSSLIYASSGQSVYVVDVATGLTVAQYNLGREIGAIDLSADGHYMGVSSNSNGTSAPQNTATFSRIDLNTGTIEHFSFVTTRVDPTSVIVSDFLDIVQLPGNRIMATTQQLGGGVVIIDLNGATPTVTKLAASNVSGFLEASADHTKVTITGRAIYHYVDGTGFTGSIGYDPYAGASLPDGLAEFRVAAIAPNADIILLDDGVYNSALQLQSAVQSQFRVPVSEPVFSADGSRLYGMVDNLLAVYDTTTWQVIAAYPMGTTAALNFQAAGVGNYAYTGFGDSLEVSGDGRYVSLIAAAGVIVLDLQTAISIATPGSDDLRGDRTQIGLGGNDRLGGLGSLNLYGGTGDDEYTVSSSLVRIIEFSNEGTDTALVEVAAFTLPQHVENAAITTVAGTTLTGNSSANLLTGNAGADWILGADGDDILFGYGGADTLEGNAGDDSLDGGSDADLLVGGAGADMLRGDDGNDRLFSANYASYTVNDDVSAEVDVLTAGAGNDEVWIGCGDIADGGDGIDTLALSLFASPNGLSFDTAGLLGSTPFGLGGGTIVNFEVLSRLRGSEYADTLTISGLSGALTVDAGDGDDTIIATNTAVTAIGGGGNDRFYSGSAADNFDGGGGTNTLDYSLFTSGIVAGFTGYGSGNGPGGDTFRNIQVLAGSNYADLLTGSIYEDGLSGNGGDDVLIGGNGADILNGGDGDDTLYSQFQTAAFAPPTYGNLGVAPTLDLWRDRDTLNGGAGNDVIFSGTGDFVDGGDGFDTLYVSFQGYIIGYTGVSVNFTLPSASYAAGVIRGIEHVAWVQGSSFNDTIRLDNASGVLAAAFGSYGNDQLTAGLFTGSLSGEEDNDTLNGTGSQNLIFLDGGNGNDRLIIGATNAGAAIIGGSGTDTLAIAGSVGSLAAVEGIEVIEFQGGATLSLTAAQFVAGGLASATLSGSGTLSISIASTDLELYLQQLTLASGANVSILVSGSSADDAIKGALQAANIINGGGGSDQIRGGALTDVIDGGDGDDKIVGAGGADILTGGAGADTFRFQAVTNSGIGAAADRITDFAIGTDRLAFTLIDTDPIAPGDQGFAFIGTAAFGASGAAQMRYATSGADLLVQADVNGDGIADMEIVLQGLAGQTLTSGDFLL